MDLNDTLGTLPSGNVARLSDDALTRFLRDTYLAKDAEKARRLEARKRLDFYEDNADSYLTADLEALFKNARVLAWRKALLPFSQYQNLTRRIVREISAVYSEPATRTIKGKAANETYQDFQRTLEMDRRMRKVNRLLNLLNDCLVYPWVEQDGNPRLDIVTPDRFYAISHPNDPTKFVGAVIDKVPHGTEVRETSPHYMVCDEDTWFWLDKDWRMVRDPGRERKPHRRGRIPVILAQRERPESTLLDATSGKDLISAHRAIALLNILMLKAQKSGTRMPIATGDTSGMAREQPMDEEGLVEAPEGVAITTLDLRADPDNYITAARAVIKQVASNYGISESVFDLSYQATSGFEVELKRIALREVRNEQILDYRPLERDLADLQSSVMTGRALAFATDKWKISFGETETPTEPLARLQYWEKLQKMGLANVYEMYREQNPEATFDEAVKAVELNMQMWLEKVRRFQTVSASPFAPDGQTAAAPKKGNGKDDQPEQPGVPRPERDGDA